MVYENVSFFITFSGIRLCQPLIFPREAVTKISSNTVPAPISQSCNIDYDWDDRKTMVIFWTLVERSWKSQDEICLIMESRSLTWTDRLQEHDWEDSEAVSVGLFSRRLSIARAIRAAGRLLSEMTALFSSISSSIVVPSVTHFGGVGHTNSQMLILGS